MKKKIIEFKTADIIIKNLRKNKKVVFTNGCFDILHIGHARYLKEAKDCGDILVVGLNSDESVKRLKGNSRPIISENDRAEMLSHLESVDFVIIFNEETFNSKHCYRFWWCGKIIIRCDKKFKE